MHDATTFGTNDLQKFFCQCFNINIQRQTANEAILFCRGIKMEASQYFDREKLFDWLFV